MEEHRSTEFGSGGIVVKTPGGGVARPLYAGELHYFRTDVASWRPALEAMADAGFTAVSTIVPWNVHEERPGRYRWSGQLDLTRFLDEAHACGLMVIAKPGPQCGGELNFLGIPRRILENQAHLAVTARGTPAWLPTIPSMFPLPSYASEGYIREAGGWLAEVARVLAPTQAPEGPLVAVGLDNHLGGFYRSAAYDIDYHPDALAWWAEHSGDREAPRAWSEGNANLCARWVEFKEVYVARAMTWISEALATAGLDAIARYHNAPPVAPGNVGALRVSGRTSSLAAWDVYQLASGFEHMRELGRYLAGSTAVPFASALGCGAPSYLPPATLENQRTAAIATLGAGVRALNISMYGKRDRWTGAATEAGEDHWVKPLLTALGALDWASLHLDAPVAIIESRADSRYGVASSTLGPVTPQLSGLVDMGPGGFAEFGRDEGARITGRWSKAVRRALDAFEIPYVIVDEAAPLDTLDRFRLIVCPTHERIDAGLWSKLGVVAGAETRVILGPGLPRCDAFGTELDDAELIGGMGLLRAESLDDVEALGGDLSAALGQLDDNWIAPNAESVGCVVHRDTNGEVRALALINSGEAQRAQLAVPPHTVIRDAMSDEEWRDVGAGVVEVALEARSARLLQVASSP